MIEQEVRAIHSTADTAPRLGNGGGVTFCGRCGGANDAANLFCGRCGHALAAPIKTEMLPHAAVQADARDDLPSRTAPAYQVGPAYAQDRLAGFGPRMLAFLIDIVLVGIVSGILRGVDMRAIASLADCAYFVAFWSTTGQTLGMRAMRITVVRGDGQPLSWVTGLLRYIGYILSIIPLGLGLLWILWDAEKQGWHDKIAGTLVVRERCMRQP